VPLCWRSASGRATEFYLIANPSGASPAGRPRLSRPENQGHGMSMRGGAVCHIRAISAVAVAFILHSTFCILHSNRAPGSGFRRRGRGTVTSNFCIHLSSFLLPRTAGVFVAQRVEAGGCQGFLLAIRLQHLSLSEFQLSALSAGVGIQLGQGAELVAGHFDAVFPSQPVQQSAPGLPLVGVACQQEANEVVPSRRSALFDSAVRPAPFRV
jgi:hypothetical protein